MKDFKPWLAAVESIAEPTGTKDEIKDAYRFLGFAAAWDASLLLDGRKFAALGLTVTKLKAAGLVNDDGVPIPRRQA